MSQDDFPTYQDWKMCRSDVANPAVQSILDQVKEKLILGERPPIYLHCWPDYDVREAVETILKEKGWKARWESEYLDLDQGAYLSVDEGPK